MDLIIRFFWDESGAPAVEYALLLAFIAITIAVSISALGNGVINLFGRAAERWPATKV